MDLCGEIDNALAATQAQPAAQDDDLLLELEGLRESLETARHNWRAFEDRCGDLQVENGKLRDRIAAAPAQPEVQRLVSVPRELAVQLRAYTLAWAAEYEYRHRTRGFHHEHVCALEQLDAALAASTGQEVES